MRQGQARRAGRRTDRRADVVSEHRALCAPAKQTVGRPAEHACLAVRPRRGPRLTGTRYDDGGEGQSSGATSKFAGLTHPKYEQSEPCVSTNPCSMARNDAPCPSQSHAQTPLIKLFLFFARSSASLAKPILKVFDSASARKNAVSTRSAGGARIAATPCGAQCEWGAPKGAGPRGHKEIRVLHTRHILGQQGKGGATLNSDAPKERRVFCPQRTLKIL